jgi:hypothetical protein
MNKIQALQKVVEKEFITGDGIFYWAEVVVDTNSDTGTEVELHLGVPCEDASVVISGADDIHEFRLWLDNLDNGYVTEPKKGEEPPPENDLDDWDRDDSADLIDTEDEWDGHVEWTDEEWDEWDEMWTRQTEVSKDTDDLVYDMNREFDGNDDDIPYFAIETAEGLIG